MEGGLNPFVGFQGSSWMGKKPSQSIELRCHMENGGEKIQGFPPNIMTLRPAGVWLKQNPSVGFEISKVKVVLA